MDEGLSIGVRLLPHAVGLPSYAHDSDAGADLLAAEDVMLAPGERAAVPTGICIELPDGYVGLVHPRSGLALRHGLALVNAPGTIDAGYRGEIKVLVLNTDQREPIGLRRGDRIAQLLIQPVVRASFRVMAELSGSRRADGGFGSTGGWTHHGGHVPGGPTGTDEANGPGHGPAGG